jgi:hypothetical protein
MTNKNHYTMKIRFFRFAAALIAGASLLATACTDIGADIKSVDEKYSELPGRVASLDSQLGALQTTLATTYETIANHNADMQGLRGEITALLDAKLDKSTYEAFQASVANAQTVLAGLKYADKDFVNQVAGLLKDLAALTAGDWTAAGVKYATVQEYIDGEIARLEGRLTTAEKAIEDLTKEGGVLDQIKKDIENLQNKKLDKLTFDEYKEATAFTIGLLQKAITNLVALTGGFPEDTTIKDYIDALAAKLDDYVLTSTFNTFTATVVTLDKLDELKTELDGRFKSLEDLLKGEWGDKTVQQYIDDQIFVLHGQLAQITNTEGTGRLDVLENAAAEYFNQVDKIWGLIKFADGYTGEYGDGLEGYIDAGDMWALNAAKDYTDDLISNLIDALNGIFDEIFSRVQSIVLVPAFDDGKMSIVGGGAEVNTFKIMPTDAAKTVVEAFAADPTSFSLDVKTVETRAGGDVPLKLTVTDVKFNAANADKGWVDVYVDSNFNTLSAADQAKSYSAALVIDGAGTSISSPFYGVFVDESIVRYKLTPLDKYGDPEDIIIAWNYKFYDDICDTLVAKILVDGDRSKLIGGAVRKDHSWNVVSGADYFDGTGAITTHTNDAKAIDVTLCSAAEYGVSDSTYLHSLQIYDAVEDITYIGEFNYIVKARPADTVIELDPVEAKVGDISVDIAPLTALYNKHKSYYSKYYLADVAHDFINTAKIDAKKVTFDGASISAAVGCHFGFDSGEEKTFFSIDLNKAGAWKVYVYTHFVNVGYTFIVPINVK